MLPVGFWFYVTSVQETRHTIRRKTTSLVRFGISPTAEKNCSFVVYSTTSDDSTIAEVIVAGAQYVQVLTLTNEAYPLVFT